ncbi:MAG TPA: acyl-CoA thioesterase [Planctomycetota bacterium]|nr:acyl-CoA thioesterase [Planctomycetota bacterium]
MENYALVRPEHLNHYGHLFGGVLLKWVDEYAWLAASRDYPGCRFVTVGMDRVEFKHPVGPGAILRFHITRAKEGTTSVTYAVEVLSRGVDAPDETSIFTTHVTFVSVDEQGKKCACRGEKP